MQISYKNTRYMNYYYAKKKEFHTKWYKKRNEIRSTKELRQ